MSLLSFFKNREIEDDDPLRWRDCLRQVLVAYGRYGFDLPDSSAHELQETASTLAQRLGSPPDLLGESMPAPDAQTIARFVERRRQAEQSYVAQTIPMLQTTVLGIVKRVSNLIGVEAKEDEALEGAMERLGEALSGGSANHLQAAAEEALHAMHDSLHRRQSRNRAELEHMGQRLKELRARVAEAEARSSEDRLTRLPNRAALDARLDQEVMVAELTGEPLTVLMLDVDHFKRFNDTHGHAAGDRVLEAVGDALVRCFPRKSDFAARYGGEEFGVVLSDVPLERGVELAERFRAAMESLVVVYEEKDLQVTCSIGAAELRPRENPSGLLGRADEALYAAKRNGRNRVEAAPRSPSPSPLG